MLVKLVLLASPPSWFFSGKKVKTALCWSHDLHMARNGFLVKFQQGGYSKSYFFGQVHFQCILGTKCTCHFKIICQSSQGHILSKKSIDFMGHCSCLLGKVKDKSFKCKLTEIVMSFLIFLVPIQSQWKNWYLVPSELIYVLQRNSE